MKNDKLVSLAMFRYSHRAHILQALLKEAGIESQVSTSSVFRQIDSAKVIVNMDDITKAREILIANRHEFSDDEIEEL